MTTWLVFVIGAVIGYVFGFGYMAVHAPSASRLAGLAVVIGFAAAFGFLAVIAFGGHLA